MLTKSHFSIINYENYKNKFYVPGGKINLIIVPCLSNLLALPSILWALSQVSEILARKEIS